MYSVVIPVYNHAKYLRRAIDSVLMQTAAATEIIVIDDGSSDESLAVAKQIAALDARIILWSQPNRGAHYTINAGLHRATADFVAILNSDDAFEPTRMEHCLNHLATNGDVDAVFTRVSCIDSNGRNVTNPWYEDILSALRPGVDKALSLLNGNYILTTSNLVARRAFFEDVGYFYPLRYAHDLEFCVRALRLGMNIEMLSDSLLQYRTHASNTINENHQKVRVEWAAILAWHAISTGRRMDRSVEMADLTDTVSHIVKRHNLSGLVAYMSLASTMVPIGLSLFTCRAWPKISECALEFDV